MKKRFNLKAKLAELLAAVMVFSMAAPGIPAYAVNYGETSVIEFDPQAGPGLLHSSYSGVPRRADGVSFATGQAGHPLTDSADFPEKILGPGRGRKSRNLMSRGTATRLMAGITRRETRFCPCRTHFPIRR